jgi:hypothetical protein
MRVPGRSLSLLVLLAALSGCGAAATVKATDPPTSPMSATTTATTPPATPVPLTSRLLPTSAIRALYAQYPWQDGRTGPDSSAPDRCAVAGLPAIGATDAVRRTYFPGDDSADLAQETVGDFPDAKTVTTAWAVLASWHDRCLRRLTGYLHPSVGAVHTLAVPQGQAGWYVVSGRVPGEETDRTYGIGWVRSGTRIAVVQVFTTIPARTPSPLQATLVAMVTGAAASLA